MLSMQWKSRAAIIPPLFLISSLCASFSIVLAQSSPGPAKPVDLDAILLHLQNNLTDYKSSIPNFFCDEQVISSMNVRGKHHAMANPNTTTNSIFRLERAADAQGSYLKESREIKAVNGVPTHINTMRGPTIFTGAFSNALEIVSLDLKHCYDYRLISGELPNHTAALVINYSLKEAAVKDETCPGPELHHGSAYVDPKTMRIVRLEMLTPKRQISPATYGPWFWTIEYAPVVFDNRSFWMPDTITSKATTETRSVEWDFTATYSHYHRLTVHSKILPNVDETPK